MHLINKDALIAEIERIKKQDYYDIHDEYDGFVRNALDKVLSFIDTLEVKEESEWNEKSIKPPFTSSYDGNKYSDEVLCKNKAGGYDIAQYVRWRTGYCGWFSGEDEVNISHWKELK